MLQWSTTAIWECKYQEKKSLWYSKENNYYSPSLTKRVEHLHHPPSPLPKLFQWSQSSAFRSKSALTLVLGEVKVWGEGRRLIFRYHPASLHCRYFIVGGASRHYKLGGGGHGLREDFVPPPHPPHLLCSNDNLLCKNTFSLPNLPLLTESIMAVKEEVFNPFTPKIS